MQPLKGTFFARSRRLEPSSVKIGRPVQPVDDIKVDDIKTVKKLQIY